MATIFKTEQLTEQSTTSATMIDVPGSSLTFTPDNTSDIWLIFASGLIRSTSTSEVSSEMSLVINGTEVDLWGHQNNTATDNLYAGFITFERITGTVASQTIKIQFRSAAGTTYADNLRIVAAKLPENADFQFVESDAMVETTGANTSILSHTWTPNSSGNYYIFGKVSHREYPYGSTSRAWLDGADGSLHPNAPAGTHHSNARDSWSPLMSFYRQNLTDSSQTVRLRFTSSAAGAEASQHRYRRIMMFREDVWDDANYDISTGQSTTTSTNFQIKNSVTVSAPPESRDFLSIQSTRISGPSSTTSRKSGELRCNGSALVRTDHKINRDGSSAQGYHHIIGVADVKSTAASITFENGFLSPDAATVECAESAILVLRYPSQIILQNSTFFGMIA